MQPVAEVQVPAGSALPAEVYDAPEPVILRGFIAHWPATRAALQSAEAVADYLTRFDAQQALTVYVGGREIDGRFFYSEDCTGFNFRSGTATLAQVLARLLGPDVADDIDTIYVGSTPVDQWLPGFRKENDIALPVDDAMASFWLGSRTRVSAHFDFPDNVACVVAGVREFTLFPPDQIDNLYVGPIDRTPSGQAISMVDFAHPDPERWPRFRIALAHAQTARLHPGDAIFIPSMWWHHVVAEEPFNLLVNYWWCGTPDTLGAPSAALSHAILALRSLPERQRMAWKHLFDHYVFHADEQVVDHIPEAGRGILGDLDTATINRARAELVKRLNP